MKTISARAPFGQVAGKSGIFWGEVTPCEHLVQIYQTSAAFLDSLEGFIAGGIMAGEGVIVIATAEHRFALNQRLDALGIDVTAALASEQYLVMDAEETLASFMVQDWPDETLFTAVVRNLLVRARANGRGVRAFGEMVALLWARGNRDATLRLEYLWHRMCQAESFSLFCAYPRAGFTQDASTSIQQICDAHSNVVAG
jgi:hypothetical protein